MLPYRILTLSSFEMKSIEFEEVSQDLLDYEQQVQDKMKGFYTIITKAGFDYKQHQYEGVEWCLRNETSLAPYGGCRGGFVADEMGLGKTITMIGTMFVNFVKRTLIVVPPILLEQWWREIYRASGHNALIYYGKEKHTITPDVLAAAPIVLTTYGSVQDKMCLLRDVVWSRIIFDEAHHLKNADTITYKCCKMLKSSIRWLISGTPIQNKLQDFYNLCSMAGLKGETYAYKANHPIIRQKLMLRRTKAEVGIKMPPLQYEIIEVAWNNPTTEQLSKEIHVLLANQTCVSGDCWGKASDAFVEGGSLLAILRAKQMCIMPALMKEKLEQIGLYGEYEKAMNYCGPKLDAVSKKIIERKDNDKGKLVFCHFQKEIDTLKQLLVDGGVKKVLVYDGRTNNLDLLQEAADVLILQIQTGCEGLNLQEHYSEIYFVSPHWNPCVEDQAIGRCYRIGQTKPVVVFWFVSTFALSPCFDKENDSPISLDGYITSVQDGKREIIQSIIGN